MQGIAELVERQGLNVEFNVGAGVFGRGSGEDAQLRRRHRERPPPEECVLQAHLGLADQRVVGLVERWYARDPKDRSLLKMVLQISTYPVESMNDVDAAVAQPIGRSDAGPLKNLHRPDRAGSEQQFAPGVGPKVAIAQPVAQAAHALAFELEPVDGRFRDHAQVPPRQDRLEITSCGRPPETPFLVDVEVAHAFVVSGVEVVGPRYAHLRGRFADEVEDLPGDAGRLDTPPTLDAMVFGLAEEVVLKLLEER